jgi:hypothetical protein
MNETIYTAYILSPEVWLEPPKSRFDMRCAGVVQTLLCCSHETLFIGLALRGEPQRWVVSMPINVPYHLPWNV